jgi:hypothetical protein
MPELPEFRIVRGARGTRMGSLDPGALDFNRTQARSRLPLIKAGDDEEGEVGKVINPARWCLSTSLTLRGSFHIN